MLELGPGVWPFTVTDPAHDRSQAVRTKNACAESLSTLERRARSGRQLQATARSVSGSSRLTGDKEQCQDD